ncbi:uncharacterized protein I303_102862 [Kwoniella dejecticola CBS 10117]|uniref:Transmembrane protein n=1 Tax=Kwoniella dejecticola CBS 10117 TaxID=1296121 RepID=A0A1A6A9Y3_9TREE|nr:uncharacterized protein I303_02880 [Kwoniella dejecticola CBS 10117]OBR86861.1 hypothetical protein I303_02880 [Kwoniella dejecticola CBS 10117]
MAPFSPLPPSHDHITRALQPPRFPLLFGQANLRQHDLSQAPSKPSPSLQHGRSRRHTFFQGGHLSFGILLCLFISTLWLIAAFSAAQLSLSLPSPSDLVYVESEGLAVTMTESEASTWGEVGLFELSAWRRTRVGPVDKEDKTSQRWKRNEAVLERLKESRSKSKALPSVDSLRQATTTFTPFLSDQKVGQEPVEPIEHSQLLLQMPSTGKVDQLLLKPQDHMSLPDASTTQLTRDDLMDRATPDFVAMIDALVMEKAEDVPHEEVPNDGAYPLEAEMTQEDSNHAIREAVLSHSAENSGKLLESRRHHRYHEDAQYVDGGI